MAAYVMLVGFPLSQICTGEPVDFTERPAVFKITTDVVNQNVQPYTVTAPSFGNTLKRGGKGAFEPATFRTRFEAQEDSPDRIYDGRGKGISYYDVYQSGYLDGAEVRIYRLIDGEVELVREDSVVPGGTVIESWNEIGGSKIIPAGNTTGQFKWAPWSRVNAERWFTVFAVDSGGNVSEPATPIRLKRTEPGADAKESNFFRNFRASGGDSAAPPAPDNFRAEVNEQGVVVFSWDAVSAPDLAGYRIARSDTDPAAHRGVYLQLSGKPSDPGKHTKRGDMVIVSRSLHDFSRQWLSNRVGNLDRQISHYLPDGVPNGFHPDEVPGKSWRLAEHGADTPVTNPGEYYFEMTLRQGDQELVGKHGIPDLSTTQQNFYPVPEDGAEYIMEVWMKADSKDRAPVVFTWDGDETIGGFVGAHSLELTNEWKKYEVRFTGQSSAEGHHAYLVLKTKGPGTFSFDNFRVYRADTDYLDYLPHEYTKLRESGMSAFRTHGPIKTGTQTYSMRQFLGEAGQAEGIAKGNTLPQALKVCEKAGIDPWLQIEYHMSPEEWMAFMEYVAAPFDPVEDSATNKPYAALRYHQGRPEPWIQAFDRIYFELSNETWNGMFFPWTFDTMTDAATGELHRRGEVYAKFHDYVADILRSSPHWKTRYEDRFIHVLGGWSTSLNNSSLTRGYTQEIASATNSGEFITIAAYNGGWDEGEGPPQPNAPSYFNVLSQVNQTAIPRIIRMNEVAETAAGRLGREVHFGTYEAGPGYAMNGLNNARVTAEQKQAQELVMKSKLAGVATLDSFLSRNRYGSSIENFFTFAQGDLWKSHASEHRGGQPHASFLPLVLFNQVATGDMLRVETKSTPTVDVEKSRRRSAVDDAALTAVHATRSGNQVAVFCINRMIPGYPEPGHDGHAPFGLMLPFSKAETITLFRLTGEPTDHNIHQENVKVERVSLDPAQLQPDGKFIVGPSTGGTARGMPPSEVFLYVFDGTDIGPESRIRLPEAVRAQPYGFSPDTP